MRRPSSRVAALATLAAVVALGRAEHAGRTATPDEPMTAQAVLDRVDEVLFPPSFAMDIRLTDHKPRVPERVFRIHVMGVRRTASLLTFTAPPTETGKRYLFRDRSIWISIPGLPNVVRVSSKEGFMDSSFSNSDLMDTGYGDDYDSHVEEMAVRDGRRVYVLRCRAKTPRVTYAAIKMVVEAETFIPREFEYFSRSGLRTKAASFGADKVLARRVRPSRIAMRDDAVEGSHSVIDIDTMEEAAVPPGSLSVEGFR